MIVLAAAAAVIATFWVALALPPLRRFPRDHFLRPVEPPVAGPRVAVLVPARDEASMLPLTLPSLLMQRYPDWELVLVDDGSTDGTAETAARLAAQPPPGAAERPASGAREVRVVTAGEKPAGWAGKMHALQRGHQPGTG